MKKLLVLLMLGAFGRHDRQHRRLRRQDSSAVDGVRTLHEAAEADQRIPVGLVHSRELIGYLAYVTGRVGRSSRPTDETRRWASKTRPTLPGDANATVLAGYDGGLVDRRLARGLQRFAGNGEVQKPGQTRARRRERELAPSPCAAHFFSSGSSFRW